MFYCSNRNFRILAARGNSRIKLLNCLVIPISGRVTVWLKMGHALHNAAWSAAHVLLQ